MRVPVDVRRQQFIDAAVSVIAREGVDGATTRRIADAAGAPLTTLHYCFRSKENLLWATFESLAAMVSLEVEGAAAPGQSLAGVATNLLSDAVRWGVANPEANRAQIEILLWAERNDRPLAARIYDTFTETWKGILRQARTPLPEDELDSLTRVLVAVVDGLCLQLITHGDGEQTMRDTATALSLLSAYLGRRPRRAA